MVSEDTGSLVETQEALGHRNLATTRVYVNSIAVKKDKHSKGISERLGIFNGPNGNLMLGFVMRCYRRACVRMGVPFLMTHLCGQGMFVRKGLVRH